MSVALFVAQMPNLLHFCASSLCTIEVEIGFLGIRCVQWQDLDVMTRCSNKVFQLQAWGKENDELKLYQLVAGHRFGHMYHICIF